MRATESEVRPRTHAPEPTYSMRGTILASVLATVTIAMVVLAAASPAAAAVVVVASVVAHRGGRTLIRRRRSGRTRSVCLPRLDVCIVV